jgi:dihydrofolate synthase / folylpolyglutamate synthase
MKDKSAREMLDVLVPLADLIILTKPDNTRALEPKALREMLPEGIAAALTDNVEEAIHHAAGASVNKIIVVTGSLYLVGEAKRLMEEQTAI